MVFPENNSNWQFDYGLLEDIPLPGGDLPALESGFHWPSIALPDSTGLRVKYGSCSASDSKVCRERMRRDRLNDRFQELSSVLEPGRLPKMDKAVILCDAVRMVTQLRDEAERLKELHENLQEKINESKAEKNELRAEKQTLKAEKEKLEQQLKTLQTQPDFFPSAVPVPFPAPGQVFGGKIVPFMGYLSVPMWLLTHLRIKLSTPQLLNFAVLW